MLLYMPTLKTGKFRKLALPNRGPYVIANRSSSGARRWKKSVRVAYERLRPYKEELERNRQEEDSNSVEEDEVIDQVTNLWRGRLRPRIRKLSVMRTSMQEPGRCKRPKIYGSP